MPPRVDVTLRGTPPVGVHATVSPNSVARTVALPTPSVFRGVTVTPASISRAVVLGATPVAPSREDLVVGTVKPDTFNTGVLPDITRTTVNGNVTLDATWSNQVYENRTLNGRITVTGPFVTIRNLLIQGNTSSPGNPISCNSASVTNLVIEDVYIRPATLQYQYGTGVIGHDFLAKRVRIEGTIDGFGVYNTTATKPYPTNVTISMCWVNRLIWWTDDVTGTVHSSDKWSHNDGIQLQGGWGLLVIGSLIDGRFEKQAGHWQVTNPNVEPYSTITLFSLPDGGPFYTIGDRGTGNEANGRYNDDARTAPNKPFSLTCFLINNNVGTSREITLTQNWFYGGEFGVNLGGFSRPASESPDPAFLIDVSNVRFDRTQGEQGAGGNDTNTVSGAGSGWAGSGDVISHAGTSLRNYYEDQGNISAGEINFRGD